MTTSEAANGTGINYVKASAEAERIYNYNLSSKLPDEILGIAEESIRSTDDPTTQFSWEMVKCKVEADRKRKAAQ